MSQTSTLLRALQQVISEKEVYEMAEKYGYQEIARKFTVYELLKYWVTAAVEEWNGFRDSESAMKKMADLQAVDHTTICKKSALVPYLLFKELFTLLVQRCNRQTRRTLKLPFPLYAVDATVITFTPLRMKWASFTQTRNAVRLHVQYDIEDQMPTLIEETDGRTGDSMMAEKVFPSDPGTIVVADRGYVRAKRFDKMTEDNRYFVIRVKEDYTIDRDHADIVSEPSEKIHEDIFCYVGKGSSRTKHRVRVVTFLDDKGHPIRVVTNLLDVDPKTIAQIYRLRWQIELFFRWIKQHLHVKQIYGNTPNAAYGQLFGATIAYVLLRWVYNGASQKWRTIQLTFLNFTRYWMRNLLPAEVKISIFEFLYMEHEDNLRFNERK
ncbi:IS4 family transposase [Robertmurraya sp.]|uniref:IS4 family transposase n=1 Tax=Robertmurraya sp. TaxID=2837525 RepID=UPI0037043AE1